MVQILSHFLLPEVIFDLTDNMTNYDTDQLTAKTDGDYWKAALNFNRFQRVTNTVNLNLKI